MRAILIYYTITNHTKQAVENISKGLEKREVEFEIFNVREIKYDRMDFSQYEILVIGSPTHMWGPTRKISDFIKNFTPDDLNNKRIGLVTCYAGFGGNRAINTMEKMIREKTSNIRVEKIAILAGAPGSLWTGPKASQKDVQKCIEIGERLGE